MVFLQRGMSHEEALSVRISESVPQSVPQSGPPKSTTYAKGPSTGRATREGPRNGGRDNPPLRCRRSERFCALGGARYTSGTSATYRTNMALHCIVFSPLGFPKVVWEFQDDERKWT
ncbi:hypothetical protein GCM10022403_042480 [Streptomyces coacervatus]|uniref:Uncharacterized protein n=1 Tax=Streptomyces coacervatus TaxID=647381 RepID=A0ABP7HX05_9ACTN